MSAFGCPPSAVYPRLTVRNRLLSAAACSTLLPTLGCCLPSLAYPRLTALSCLSMLLPALSCGLPWAVACPRLLPALCSSPLATCAAARCCLPSVAFPRPPALSCCPGCRGHVCSELYCCVVVIVLVTVCGGVPGGCKPARTLFQRQGAKEKEMNQFSREASMACVDAKGCRYECNISITLTKVTGR